MRVGEREERRREGGKQERGRREGVKGRVKRECRGREETCMKAPVNSHQRRANIHTVKRPKTYHTLDIRC